MPTGNEYSDVRLSNSSGNDQSYKQHEQEENPKGGAYGQGNESTAPQPTSGQYPNTFDRATPSEPLGTQSDDNPFYYPQKVFDRIPCTGPGQSYVQTERESVSGEYGQSDCRGMLGDYLQGDNMVPDPVPSKQFSSDKEGDPKKLVRQATVSVYAHSDMMKAYGYNLPVATMGSHPWLRDELATQDETEPGNAEPRLELKIPKRDTKV